jgi:hypothetical protein
MRGFPDAYTNYTTIRPQCLNPHHRLCGRKRYARAFVYGQRNSLPFSTAGTHLEVRYRMRRVSEMGRGLAI